MMMKKVTCINCGFLCWAVSDMRDEFGITIKHDELHGFWRNREGLEKLKSGIHEDEILNESRQVSCLRNQWIFAVTPLDNRHRWADIETIITPRRCIYYAKYQPGFAPEEHKELQREANTTRTIRNATIIGASIGATAAIAAQILYALFSGGNR